MVANKNEQDECQSTVGCTAVFTCLAFGCLLSAQWGVKVPIEDYNNNLVTTQEFVHSIARTNFTCYSYDSCFDASNDDLSKSNLPECTAIANQDVLRLQDITQCIVRDFKRVQICMTKKSQCTLIAFAIFFNTLNNATLMVFVRDYTLVCPEILPQCSANMNYHTLDYQMHTVFYNSRNPTDFRFEPKEYWSTYVALRVIGILSAIFASCGIVVIAEMACLKKRNGNVTPFVFSNEGSTRHVEQPSQNIQDTKDLKDMEEEQLEGIVCLDNTTTPGEETEGM